MTLDVNSRHGVLIGIVTIAIALPMIIHGVPDILEALNHEDTEYENNIEYIFNVVKSEAFCLLAVISGFLLICGIFKQQRWLLIPWLATEILFSTLSSISPIYHFYGLEFVIIVFALQALLFYPIGNLYFAIGRRNAVKAATL